MVRTVADRAFLPTKNVLEEVGDMMILTGKTIMSALRPPYPYGGEFVSQFLFALRLCWFPLLVSTVAFGYGAPNSTRKFAAWRPGAPYPNAIVEIVSGSQQRRSMNRNCCTNSVPYG